MNMPENKGPVGPVMSLERLKALHTTLFELKMFARFSGLNFDDVVIEEITDIEEWIEETVNIMARLSTPPKPPTGQGGSSL